jgi:hypothetical protein
MSEEFRRRLTELTNASYDCGSFEFTNGTKAESENYQKLLTRFHELNQNFLIDCEPKGEQCYDV